MRSRAIVPPFPARQKRWMPVARITSSPVSTSNVAAGGVLGDSRRAGLGGAGAIGGEQDRADDGGEPAWKPHGRGTSDGGTDPIPEERHPFQRNP